MKIESLQLSVRSENCLKQQQIYYINDLIVLDESHLMRFPSLGIKSLKEIKEKLSVIDLCLGMSVSKKYINKELKVNMWLDHISDFPLKEAKLKNCLLSAIENLSTRSQNAINSEFKRHNNIVNFLKYLFSQSISTLPNVGKKSELEIQKFLNNIHQDIECLYKSKRMNIDTTLDLMEYMHLPQYCIDEYQKKHLNNGIHFFTILNLLIEYSFDKRSLKILKHRTCYWLENKFSLEKLGKEFGITRERVRQIEKKESKKLWSVIRGLSSYVFLFKIKQQYQLQGSLISNINTINKRDDTRFSDNFLYNVLAILLKNDYQLIIKDKNNCRFLIKNHLIDAFDFNGFIKKIKILQREFKSDTKLDFKGVLSSYFKLINNDEIAIEIESICEDLLNLEFNIVPDFNNQILIKGKRKKSTDFYIKEVLNNINKPAHLDTIYNEIKRIYPKFSQSKKYIGNALVGNDKFIYFDRNSTYGLKSWERKLTQNSILVDIVKPNKTSNNRSGIKVWCDNKKIIVKGGSIISIVLEYLKQFEEPKHIDDILCEVQKWREINKHKLMSNLKINNRNHFVFYERSFVGLINEQAD